MGGDLSDIRFKANGRQIATFHFIGPELHNQRQGMLPLF